MAEPARALVRRWILLASATAALVACVRGPLSGPPLAGPPALAAWARSRPPDVVAMASICDVALAAGAYLLVVLTLALIGSLIECRSALALARRLSPPGVRRLLAVATTATVAAGLMGGVAGATVVPAGAGAAAAPPAAGPPTMRRVADAPSHVDPPGLWRVHPAASTSPETAPARRPSAREPTTTAPTARDRRSPSPRPARPGRGVVAAGTGTKADAPPVDGAILPGSHPAGVSAGRIDASRSSRTQDRVVSSAGAGETTMYVVRPGDSFWSVAAAHARPGPDGRPTARRAVALYWARLVAANRSRLPVPGCPDVLFPGDVIELPPA